MKVMSCEEVSDRHGGDKCTVLAEIFSRKDGIWNIYAQSAKYSAIYRTKMGHEYTEWTYLA